MNPGFEPSLEIESRGTPDLLDLGVALVSGMIAAYAMGRPKVASTLAGVAIAAALVPPLAVVGIGLTNDRPLIAANSSVLLMTNVVAIILGAVLVFRTLGVHQARQGKAVPLWGRVFVTALLVAVAILALPLTEQIARERRTGPDRPLSYPVARRVREVVKEHLQGQTGVKLILMGRVSVEPKTGITVLLASDRELPAEFETNLRRIISDARGRETVVTVFSLMDAAGAADTLP